MKVEQVPWEPTRFYVESTSLECGKCNRQFSRLETRFAEFKEGEHCPKCTDPNAQLRQRWHMVDISVHWPIGSCSCEGFTMSRRKELNGQSPDNYLSKLTLAAREALTQRKASQLRCHHIEAARTCALNLTIKQFKQIR